MIVLESIKDVFSQFGSSVITIGNFDGVHIGHQVLFSKTVKIAKKIAATSIALTFKPHPTQILKRDVLPKLITSYDQKKELIGSQGIDILLCIPFTEKFASISAVEFIKDILVKQLGMKVLIIGEGYVFGKDRIGNTFLLEKYAAKFGFKVVIEKLVKSSGTLSNHISSTAIRNMIMNGNIEKATEMLGRNYCMKGKVIHGKNRGKKLLGFPTANIYPYNSLYPKKGVYAVAVKYENCMFNGVANIGYNPTFKNKSLSLEVHILFFNKDIYGKEIEISFIKHIRDEIKFSNTSELERQIGKDIIQAKRYYIIKTNNSRTTRELNIF